LEHIWKIFCYCTSVVKILYCSIWAILHCNIFTIENFWEILFRILNKYFLFGVWMNKFVKKIWEKNVIVWWIW
jgi:hypothetical protein